MQDNASPGWDDMFAECTMLFDINGWLQLLFVLPETRLTQGLISPTRRHFLNLNTLCHWMSLDTFVKLCQENSLHPPEYRGAGQWTNHSLPTRWGDVTISLPRTCKVRLSEVHWSVSVSSISISARHHHTLSPSLFSLCCQVVTKTRFSGQRLHPYVWPQVFLNPW